MSLFLSFLLSFPSVDCPWSILIILKENKNFSKPVFIGTHYLVCCLTQECLTWQADWRLIQCWLSFNSYLRYIFLMISPFANEKIANWWCRAYHRSSFHFHVQLSFFFLLLFWSRQVVWKMELTHLSTKNSIPNAVFDKYVGLRWRSWKYG